MYPEEPIITTRVERDPSDKPSFDLSKIFSRLPALKDNGLVAVVVVIVAVWIWIWLSSPMIVTVTGTGEVSVPATNATVSFTLSSNSNNVQTAITNVNAGADLMRAFLTSQGVVETDVAQSQATVVPASLVTAGTTGFQATIAMAAKTNNISNISGLVTDLYAKGAFLVAQPLLSIENQDKLEQQAYNSALGDARRQAASVGNKHWRFIRRVVAVSQVSSPSTSTSTTKADVSNTDPNAANGVFKIAKAVTVTYKMW